MKKINVIDLFSGCGGLSFGFHLDKIFNTIFSNDIDAKIAETYKYNFPSTKFYVENVSKISKEKILNDLKIKEITVDLVIGGPPCQAFSTLGKRDINDKRVYLFKEYLRIVNDFKPKMFLFENVKGILSMNNGKLFDTILKEFKKIDYDIHYKVLNAWDYGVPQIRKRVFIFGLKRELNNYFEKIDELLLEFKAKEKINFLDATSDLPPLNPGEEKNIYISAPKNEFQKWVRNNNNFLTNHYSPKYSSKLMSIMENLKEGETPKNLPSIIRPKSGFSNTYSRLWFNKPGHTITRNFTAPSSSRCIHPKDNRSLTIREGARIQSFPDYFVFKGTSTSIKLQIGNSVPPLLSIVLSKIIKIIFEEINK